MIGVAYIAVTALLVLGLLAAIGFAREWWQDMIAVAVFFCAIGVVIWNAWGST